MVNRNPCASWENPGLDSTHPTVATIITMITQWLLLLMAIPPQHAVCKTKLSQSTMVPVLFRGEGCPLPVSPRPSPQPKAILVLLPMKIFSERPGEGRRFRGCVGKLGSSLSGGPGRFWGWTNPDQTGPQGPSKLYRRKFPGWGSVLLNFHPLAPSQFPAGVWEPVIRVPSRDSPCNLGTGFR